MAEDDDLEGLRDAIRRRGESNTATEEQRFLGLRLIPVRVTGRCRVK